MTKEEQNIAISNEYKRLKRQFSKIDGKTKSVVAGLLDRAAFMRVQLDMLEEDIKANGVTEMFKQSENQQEYVRKRPEADLYNTMNVAYQKIIKQLCDLLPKQTKTNGASDKDPFADFINSREDL